MSECARCGSPLPSDSADCESCATQSFMAARTVHDAPQIAGYEIINRIGEGGMGTVYLADESSLGRRVAIKVISGKLATDAQSRARFMREARSMATIEHANVIRVYAFGEVEAMPYLAMEYIDGETLADRIRRSGMLSVEDSVRTMRQILLALEAAWEKGIVHRDIKPSNILLDRRDQVHVADFGLAKPASLADDPVLTQSGHVLGTPYYLSPEQAQGLPTDFRSDIYSCGILLYEMLAGERPFEGTTPFAIVAKHLHETLPPIRSKRADVPNRVAKLIDLMAEKRPERRPQSYAELIGMFDALLGITPTRGIARTETLKVSRPSMRIDRSSTPQIAGAAAILLFAVALLVYFNPFAKPKTASSPKPPSSRFTVAVAPFYGPDSDSAKEGRMMAALIERSITAKLGSGNVTVAGIDETKEPVHSHDAARALGEKLGASVVVWGEAFTLKQETEIQPYFTLVHRKKDEAATTPSADAAQAVRNTADPLAEISEKSSGITRMTAEAPNQIELRKTSAEGVGEMVMFLAALHAFYQRSDPKRALELLDQAPRTAEALRLRGRAWDQLGHQDDQVSNRPAVVRASESRENAARAFEEALALDPKDVQTGADLADVYFLQGKFAQAAAEYARVAAAGQPYVAHYGIAYGGLIYVREVFRGELAAGNLILFDSGYLLAADPLSGVIRHRYQMPGSIRSITPKDDGFTVEYAGDSAGKEIASIKFTGGRFDRPFVVPRAFLFRMRGMKCSWTLAQNFTGDIGGFLEKQAVHPRFRPAAKMSPDTPQTLPQLETTLREAIRHDPTQPWHVYYLGETLWAEGRKQEAEAVWASLVSVEYGVAYYDYNWMAKQMERFGHHDWADRMASRGTLERSRLLQPPSQSTTLIERLINVSYMRIHPEDAKNVERAYRWFKRAREATGPTEFDPYFALAWAGHFRRAGDLARARTEEAYARIAALQAFNLRVTLVDYAVEFFVLCWVAFAVGSTLLLVRSALRVGAMPPSSPMSTWLRLVLVVLAFGGLLALAGLAAATPVWVIPALLAILGFVVLFVSIRSPRMRAAAAGISKRERLLVAASFGLALAAAAICVVAVDRFVALTQMPIGLADSLGHSSIVSDLEKRLTQSTPPSLRYTAAVANQLAGNIDRARELYRDLPDDKRAQRPLAAIDRGKSEIIMPSDPEMIAAFAVGGPRLVALKPDQEINPGPTAMIYAGAGVALLLFIIFMLTPPGVQAAASWMPKSRVRRTAAKVFFTVVPGAYDVMRGSAAVGFALIGLFGFTIYRLCTAIRIYPHLWLPHFFVAGMPKNAAPLPPDFRELDVLFMSAYSRLYWTLAILIVVTMLVLHAMRLPAILHLYRETPTEAAPTLVPSQQTT